MRNILNGWLWKQAETRARERNTTWQIDTPMGKSCLPYMTRERVSEVVIYKGELGGWIADVIFKDMPLGYANAFGTPVGHPCATEHEARQNAIHYLAHVIANSACQHAPQSPVFEYHGRSFKLLPELVMDVAGKFTLPEVVTALQEIDRARERRESITPAEAEAIGVVIHAAAANGVIRWPERQPAAVMV